MIFNGKSIEIKDNTSVAGFLEEKGYRREIVAVELNDEILPKDKYDEVILKDEDIIEVVTFMGGGC